MVVPPPRRVFVLRAITFGQCVFDTPGARIAPDSELHFALLLCIVTAPTDGVSRDDVVARLWPHAIGNDGRHCLRQGMYRLRQLGIPVQLNAGRLILDWSDCSADVHDLLLREPGRAELVRLGTLPFLPGYVPSLGEPFTYWVEELRTRVGARLRRALADEASAARSRGRFHEMGRLARALLALDPLNELGTIILAESLALEGSKVEALRLLEKYEAEVGVVNPNLQLPARVLRRRVAEVLDDSLFLRRYEVPFVGREETFATLRGVWREVRRGESRAAIVSGEAGIGKSRMAGELLRLAALDGGHVVRYTTSAGDAFTPLSTLITVGTQLLTLPGALGCDQEYLHYLRRLGTAETVSAFSVAGMAADVLYAQLVQAFAEVMSAIAEEAPLIVFIDDAERLHPTTWRVLVDVWDRVGQRGVLILLAARRLPQWFGSLGVRSCERLTVHVPVPPLSDSEARDFVGGWSERHDLTLDEAGVEMLLGAGHGNPFYLTELANHLGRGGDPARTPENIAALIATQCRGLGKGAQQVLLAIAVLESRASTSRATQVLELPAAEFMGALEELDVMGLVASVGPVVRVRHQMIGEGGQSLAGARVVDFTHGRVGEVLEREADETESVELLGDCVTHWERAGETRRAFAAAMKLGHRLIGLGLGEEAEKAFATAERCSQNDIEKRSAIEGGISASRLSWNWANVVRLCNERRAVIPATDSRDDEFAYAEAEANLFAFAGMANVEALHKLAADRKVAAEIRIRCASVAAMIGDNDYDSPRVRRARTSVSDLSVRNAPPNYDEHLLRLIYHTSVGDSRRVLPLALEYAERTVRAVEVQQQLFGPRRAAIALVRMGHHAEAQVLLLESIERAEYYKLTRQIFASSDVLLSSYLAAGQLELAEAPLLRGRELLRVASSEAMDAMQRYSEAQFAWLSNDASLARTLNAQTSNRSEAWLSSANFCTSVGELAIALLADSGFNSKDEIDRCAKLFARARSRGRQDVNASILIAAMRDLGLDRLATQTARRYARERREVSAPPPVARFDEFSRYLKREDR